MRFSDVLARFEGATEEGDHYIALCPAHDDSKPSLVIFRGDDLKVRLTCRATCATADVIKAVGLRWSDLFNAHGDGLTVPKERPKLVETGPTAALAHYVDVTTEALFEAKTEAAVRAVAYAEDRFGITPELAAYLGIGVDDGTAPGLVYRTEDGRTRGYRTQAFTDFARLTVPLYGFDGCPRGLQGRDITGQCPGRWVGLRNPEGQRWAPYGVFRGQGEYPVTIVSEGPGDGLTAVAVGYDAVVIRGASLAGSPDLLRELAEGLKGQQVIAAGDNDAAGLRFNQALAEGLKPHGITVYELRIPDHGPKTDLTKWREVEPGLFAEELHAAVRSAKPVLDTEEAHREKAQAVIASRTGSDAVSKDQGNEAAKALAAVIGKYGDGDTTYAHALVAWSGGTIRYAPGLGYFVWNGRVWERSEVKVRQAIHHMGAALVLVGELQKARGFTMTTRIDALMTELRSVPSVYVDASEFDAKPYLASFRNGTVDLRTGKLREHRPADMLTYFLDLDYDADAKCPRWESFLEEIFPGNPELPHYMRRLVGYGITGETGEQCFAVLWGKGANGKSVLTDTLTGVFRSFSKTTPFATFEEKTNGGIPNDLAALRGSRLVMASEGESGKPMSEAVLKRVTGKDEIAARFLRQEFFTFKPTFLLMLATNHKPKFRGQDEGLWRRVKMIPFRRWFAPHERDHDLDRKLMAEAEGIAAWAVRGAVEWYAGGLQDPGIVKKAVKEYRETSDALAGFFPGIVELADDAHVMNGSEAFLKYLDWCEAENLPSKERWTRRSFYDAMEERGVTRKKTAKGIALVGLRESAPEPISGPGIFGSD